MAIACGANMATVDSLVTLLKMRLSQWDQLQCGIESLVRDKHLEREINAAHDFRETIRAGIVAGQSAIARSYSAATAASSSIDDVTSTINSNSSSNQSNDLAKVKLPKLELPKFRNNVTEWQSFKEQFDAMVHHTSIPVINKFAYLRNSLEGESLDVIKGLALTEANYATAY